MSSSNNPAPSLPGFGKIGPSPQSPRELPEGAPPPDPHFQDEGRKGDFKKVLGDRKRSDTTQKSRDLPRKVAKEKSPYETRAKRTSNKSAKKGKIKQTSEKLSEDPLSEEEKNLETSEKMVAPLISEESLQGLLPEAKKSAPPRQRLTYITADGQEIDESELSKAELPQSKTEKVAIPKSPLLSQKRGMDRPVKEGSLPTSKTSQGDDVGSSQPSGTTTVEKKPAPKSQPTRGQESTIVDRRTSGTASQGNAPQRGDLSTGQTQQGTMQRDSLTSRSGVTKESPLSETPSSAKSDSDPSAHTTGAEKEIGRGNETQKVRGDHLKRDLEPAAPTEFGRQESRGSETRLSSNAGVEREGQKAPTAPQKGSKQEIPTQGRKSSAPTEQTTLHTVGPQKGLIETSTAQTPLTTHSQTDDKGVDDSGITPRKSGDEALHKTTRSELPQPGKGESRAATQGYHISEASSSQESTFTPLERGDTPTAKSSQSTTAPSQRSDLSEVPLPPQSSNASKEASTTPRAHKDGDTGLQTSDTVQEKESFRPRYDTTTTSMPRGKESGAITTESEATVKEEPFPKALPKALPSDSRAPQQKKGLAPAAPHEQERGDLSKETTPLQQRREVTSAIPHREERGELPKDALTSQDRRETTPTTPREQERGNLPKETFSPPPQQREGRAPAVPREQERSTLPKETLSPPPQQRKESASATPQRQERSDFPKEHAAPHQKSEATSKTPHREERGNLPKRALTRETTPATPREQERGNLSQKSAVPQQRKETTSAMPRRGEREKLPQRSQRLPSERTAKQAGIPAQKATRSRPTSERPAAREERRAAPDRNIPKAIERQRRTAPPRQSRDTARSTPIRGYDRPTHRKETFKFPEAKGDRDADIQGKTNEQQNTVKKVETPFNVTQPLSQVAAAKAQGPQGSMSTAEITSLISELTSQLLFMKGDGTSQTTFTLKNSALFAEVTVTITEFDTARGEFNISFSNLTTQAKELLDRQVNQDLLKQNLQEKGYTFHILTATTEREAPVFTDKGQSSEQEEQRERQQEREREREQPEKEFTELKELEEE